SGNPRRHELRAMPGRRAFHTTILTRQPAHRGLMVYNRALDHDLDGVNGGDIRALVKRRAARAKLVERRQVVERKLRARDGQAGYALNVQAIRAELVTLDLMTA